MVKKFTNDLNKIVPIIQFLTKNDLTEVEEKIDLGHIRVFGNIIGPGYMVKAGESVEYNPGFTEPEVDFSINSVFEDENFIIINKTGNLPIHSTGTFHQNTLIYHLKKKHKRDYLPVHRLDKETSGICLLAKNKDTARFFSSNIKSFKKKYLSIIKGSYMGPRSITLPLGYVETSLVKKRQGHKKDGKEAETAIKCLSEGVNHSLLEIEPKTGRLHQIRAHLFHYGYSILGDKMYTEREDLYLKWLDGLDEQTIIEYTGHFRQLLHAWKLSIPLKSGGFKEFSAPPPKDFIEKLKLLQLNLPSELTDN